MDTVHLTRSHTARRAAAVLLAVCVLCALFLAPAASLTVRADGRGTYVTAPDWPEGPELASDGAILMDAVTGNILYEKNVDQRMYPASITKILTALIAIEHLSLEEKITYTRDDIYTLERGASTIALRPDEELSVEESLYGLLLASGNECANGLARQTAGSVSAFVDMMNARAAELGCTGTHFANPHGLHDENHYTTPHDMAILMRAAISNATYLRFDSTRTHIIPPTNLVNETRPVKMRHEMLDPYSANYYEGVVAGKTGFTTPAGNTLVTYAVRGDLKLISVVMHSTGQQYADTKKLLDYGFSGFQSLEASSLETRFQAGSQTKDAMDAVLQDTLIGTDLAPDSWVTVPKNVSFSDLTADLVLEEQGSSFGRVVYRYEGMEVGSAALTLKSGGGQTFPFSVRSGLHIVRADGEQVLNVPLLIVIGAAAVLVIVLLLLLRKRRISRSSGNISFRTDRKGRRL